jgi:nitroreductase
METIQTIMTRRSIRSWTDEPLTDEQKRVILAAGMNAPSAADARPWQFVTIDDPAVIKAFTDMGGTEMLAEATWLVVICGDVKKEVYPGFWPQDCSCAAQNMQLAAHDIGAGAVWIAVYPLEERVQKIRTILGVPEEMTPFCVLAMGNPREKLPPEARFDASMVHLNRW